MSEVVLSYRAPSADVKAVRLRTDAFKRAAPLEFRKRGRTRTWELRVPRPDGLARLEYELEVERTNGTTETVVDPDNAHRHDPQRLAVAIMAFQAGLDVAGTPRRMAWSGQAVGR